MTLPNWTEVFQIAQTIAIIMALVFTAWEFRARTREQKFANYLYGISRFLDLQKIMVERSEVHPLYDFSKTDWVKKDYSELSPQEKSLVHYCDTIIALCETVWVAGQEGWVSKDEWSYWKSWVDQLNDSPAFRWTLNWVEDDYDEEFLANLRGKSGV